MLLPSAGATDDDHTTRSSSGTEPSGRLLAEPLVTAFVIAWCQEEPHRVGELAIVPSGVQVVLGRGAADDEPRMRFFRPHPGRLEPVPPLSSRGLSRHQMELKADSEAITVRRIGRCPMRINGVECDQGVVTWGDTLAFRQELVLLCVQRPACPLPLRHYRSRAVAFGRADPLGMVGESPAIWFLRDELAFAAMSGRHVLLVGESGTGKELAAHAIHKLSSRAHQPLIARRAATLPPNLMDAELFGNLKNYPSRGMPDRPGLVGQADGGFLFLDEIGELAPELQSHILRVLDSGGEYQRLGESTTRRSDFRLLAATNRDPADLRGDLVARLTLKVELPPLSERREDIPLLVHHLVGQAVAGSPDLARFAETTPEGVALAKVDSKLIEALLRLDYHGNIRELDAVLWKSIAASDGDFIAYDRAALANKAAGPALDPEREAGIDRGRNREPGEQEIRDALRRTGGNVARAAQELGLSSRYALYRRLVKLGIEPST
jgi:two-component system nitrogen regulation response regulator GlnG/two-component system response regulator HydG